MNKDLDSWFEKFLVKLFLTNLFLSFPFPLTKYFWLLIYGLHPDVCVNKSLIDVSLCFFLLNSFAQEKKQLQLPELGDRVSGAVSSAQEKAIGEMFLMQAYANAPLINDSIIQEYTDYRFRSWNQFPRIQSLIKVIFHPSHLSMVAMLEPLLQPSSFFL